MWHSSKEYNLLPSMRGHAHHHENVRECDVVHGPAVDEMAFVQVLQHEGWLTNIRELVDLILHVPQPHKHAIGGRRSAVNLPIHDGNVLSCSCCDTFRMAK